MKTNEISKPYLHKLFPKLSLLVAASGLLVATASPVALASDDGKKAYEANCQACHQPNGQGLAGALPPLAGNHVWPARS